MNNSMNQTLYSLAHEDSSVWEGGEVCILHTYLHVYVHLYVCVQAPM